jgi:hypothetical protein
MTMLRSHLPDLNLEDALPFIEKVIQESYEGYELKGEKLFNVSEMKHGIAQMSQVSALSPAGKVSEGAEIPQDRIRQGYSSTFKAEKYGILLSTSQESIDDERHDVISKNPRRLARAFASAQEISAAAILNSAFSTTGADGKALCATDHPLLQPGSGTSSNRQATDADLSITSLKDVMTVYKKQLDSAGNKIAVPAKYLVVPSELEYEAYEILNSVMLPGGSTNNVNSMHGRLELCCWEYLTDTDAFFVMGDKMDHEIYFFWSKRPQVSTSVEFKTEVALTKMVGRWQVGFADWRGIAGSSGAA